MPTQVDTFTVVAGTKACNAKCPFCVSRMTGFDPVLGQKPGKINMRNFRKAVQLASQAGAQTMLITGKGEPTLYPDDVSAFLKSHNGLGAPFPIVEIQTNALQIGYIAEGLTNRTGKMTRAVLQEWYDLGLDTIAISTVGIDPLLNHQVYCGGNPDIPYPDLSKTSAFLHEIGFTVRLCVMYRKGGVDSVKKFRALVDACRASDVDQLTFRNLARPYNHNGVYDEVEQDVIENRIDDNVERAIFEYVSGQTRSLVDVEPAGKLLRTLTHGAMVFDMDGQNVCLTDCLNDDKLAAQGGDLIRSLIFYRDGRVAYSWQYDGAVFLRGGIGNN